jgi:arylsulfatase A-like enzyme
VESLCRQDERSYIYAYWDDLDRLMHENGVDGPEIGELMRSLEKRTEEMASRLEDTLLIVTADHGHINNRNVEIMDYPDIADCLVRMPSIELRAANLFVKPGMEKQLEDAFARHFSDQFVLMTREEVLSQNLFGTGENHPMLESMLGDYLAIGTSSIGIAHNAPDHKGNHAGFTPEEMTIPLIAVNCGK